MANAIPVDPASPEDWAAFMARVPCRPDSGCWPWGGAMFGNGYGCFKFNGKNRRAHRVLYVWLYGEPPDGHELDHECHTRDKSCLGGTACPHRRCVNPSHLKPATKKANVLNGRGITAKFSQSTHCKAGHPLAGDNLYVAPSSGQRCCRTCRAATAKKLHPGENNAGKTHCKRGHPLSGDNVKRQPSGRACRECHRIASLAYVRRKQAKT